MKSLKLCLVILTMILVGCGNRDDTGKTTEIGLESVAYDVNQIQTENNYSISAEFKDAEIVLWDAETGTERVVIKEKYDEGGLFLSMADENKGALLYCSTPAGGQMIKQLYVTGDRWQTYRVADISSKIDGYPTSLLAQSNEHMYIGVQMRSDGYLFETDDGGKDWESVIVDESLKKCRYGYAPVQDRETGTFYVLLECDGCYFLYQTDEKLSLWKPVGAFSLDTEIRQYFIREGEMIVFDVQGISYQFSLEL